MCPLILNKEQRRSSKPAESVDRKWLEDVARRCRLAQKCLSPAEEAASPDWQALGVLIKNDVPHMLDKVAELIRSAQP
jgi:hypothetical protein